MHPTFREANLKEFREQKTAEFLDIQGFTWGTSVFHLQALECLENMNSLKIYM